MIMKEVKKMEVRDVNPFASEKITPEKLQDELWDVLTLLKSKKIKPDEANAVTMAAREICNVARLQLQYSVLTGKTRIEE